MIILHHHIKQFYWRVQDHSNYRRSRQVSNHIIKYLSTNKRQLKVNSMVLLKKEKSEEKERGRKIKRKATVKSVISAQYLPMA